MGLVSPGQTKGGEGKGEDSSKDLLLERGLEIIRPADRRAAERRSREGAALVVGIRAGSPWHQLRFAALHLPPKELVGLERLEAVGHRVDEVDPAEPYGVVEKGGLRDHVSRQDEHDVQN